MRPSKDSIYIEVAHIIARRGNCGRGKVGAVITSPDNRIISSGYNGPIDGDESCNTLQCDMGTKCKHSVHAEANAIMAAASYGIKLFMTTMYCTSAPCYNCAMLIIQSGIRKVIYTKEYTTTEGLILLRKMDVEVSKIEYEQTQDHTEYFGGPSANKGLQNY